MAIAMYSWPRNIRELEQALSLVAVPSESGYRLRLDGVLTVDGEKCAQVLESARRTVYALAG